MDYVAPSMTVFEDFTSLNWTKPMDNHEPLQINRERHASLCTGDSCACTMGQARA